jgi:hypothetical protein
VKRSKAKALMAACASPTCWSNTYQRRHPVVRARYLATEREREGRKTRATRPRCAHATVTEAALHMRDGP